MRPQRWLLLRLRASSVSSVMARSKGSINNNRKVGKTEVSKFRRCQKVTIYDNSGRRRVTFGVSSRLTSGIDRIISQGSV